MGEGVNIAPRLEGIAKLGAICLSEDAYRQVKSRFDACVLYRLRRFEGLLAVGERFLQRTETELGKMGVGEIGGAGRLVACAASALSSRTNATLIVGTPSWRHICRHEALLSPATPSVASEKSDAKPAGSDCRPELNLSPSAFV